MPALAVRPLAEPSAPLRELLILVEAALSTDGRPQGGAAPNPPPAGGEETRGGPAFPHDRVQLYRTLWQRVQQADAAERDAARGLFDGRFAAFLTLLERPFGDLDTIAALAQAHLEAHGGSLLPPAAGFVQPWLDSFGSPARDDLVLHGVRARLEGRAWGSLAGDERLLDDQQACLDIAAASPELAPLALRVLFELCLAAGAEEAAVRMLATCVEQGVHEGIAPVLLCRWLEGAEGVAGPLALSPGLQRQWLQPAALGQPAYRAMVGASLVRPALKARWLSLQALLGDDGTGVPASGAFDVLSRLDALYAAADQGEAVSAGAQALLAEQVLAPQARAALHRRCAWEAIDRADPHAAGISLAAARALQGDPQDAVLLQQLLLAVEAGVAQAAAQAAGLDGQAEWLGSRWQQEEPLWRALAGSGHEHLQPMADYQLALLYTDGSLVPTLAHKTQRLQEAHALWSALASHPAYAAEAQRRLSHAVLQRLREAEVRDRGRQHLWVPAADPQARKLMIVFSCVDTHHTYTQVPTLSRTLPGHHLLFVNNPELNWYSDAVFDEVVQLIEREVLPRFAREDVTCYFGSMGGHAALKFALHFGFQALVFNPQVDLPLWAAYRPGQREMLLAAREHANVQDAPLAAFEQSPVCYLVGSSTPDREAFARWLARVRECRHGSFIIEKFADPHHAGLVARIVPKGHVVPMLARAQERLRALAQLGEAAEGLAEVPPALVPRLWDQIEQAASLKLEVLVRGGRVFVADSQATGTR